MSNSENGRLILVDKHDLTWSKDWQFFPRFSKNVTSRHPPYLFPTLKFITPQAIWGGPVRLFEGRYSYASRPQTISCSNIKTIIRVNELFMYVCMWQSFTKHLLLLPRADTEKIFRWSAFPFFKSAPPNFKSAPKFIYLFNQKMS